MSLYFIQHKHSADACPAKDRLMGGQLLSHINNGNARKYGVKIHGDAVLDNQHIFMLIVEAENLDNIEEFMQPFQQAGEVRIWPASTCETVVKRAGC